MKAVIIIALVCVLYCGVTLVESSCNTLSTMKIIGKLCFVRDHKSNETLVNGFFGCYEGKPGKQQFIDCQTKAFGEPMSSTAAVAKACKQLTKVGEYSKCLQTEFNDQGIDLDSTVEQVNACQSEVMGIGPSWIPSCRN